MCEYLEGRGCIERCAPVSAGRNVMVLRVFGSDGVCETRALTSEDMEDQMRGKIELASQSRES